MWLSVDRLEENIVILIDDDDTLYRVSVSDYKSLTGRSPRETHMLWCELENGSIRSARFDPEETERRLQAAQARLRRLINKNHS